MIIKDTILKRNQEWLVKKIERINKRAKKLNVPEFKISFDNDRLYDSKKEQHEVDCGDEWTYSKFNDGDIVIDIIIEGENPQIKGWKLVSIFEREGEVVMTRTVPGIDHLPYYPTEIKCEHCGYNRRRRKSYLLVNEETLEYKEIGSTCVRDYFGHDPKVFLWVAGIKWEEELIAGAKDPNTDIKYEWSNVAYDLVDFLRVTKAVINQYGWVSKSKANEQNAVLDYDIDSDKKYLIPTVDYVTIQMEKRYNPDAYKTVQFIQSTDEDIQFAKDAIEYFTTQDKMNDYLFNVKNLIKLGYVPGRKEGLAASIVGSYYGHIKRVEREASKLDAKKTSEWQGNIKERKDWVLTFKYDYQYRSDFGVGNIYYFEDDNGNIFKWFTGNDLYILVEDGYKYVEKEDKIILTGSVKKHDEYKGIKQTVLTRCKIKDIIYKNKEE